MARIGAALALWAAFATGVSCVQVPELTDFFRSANGLSLLSTDAAKLANSEASYLTECGVTVPALQALRDAMYTPSMLNLDLKTVRARLLPLAYQHTPPAVLNAFFQDLRSVSGLGMLTSEAQMGAITLATQHAQPWEPKALYQVLSGIVGLPRTQAQQTALTYAAAGADPSTLNIVFQSSKRAGMGRDAALDKALSAAVVAELYGLPGRYANDGALYTAAEFQRYYGTQWFREWQAAPEEKRTAEDGKDYRASEFALYFGSSWNTKWATSPVANLRRIASDGYTYTLQQFQQHYKDTWQAEWATSYEVLDVCAGLSQQDCGAQRTCQWYWSGDPTTSCVVRPRSEEELVVV